MTEREIFAAVLEIQDADKRNEFLDLACHGDDVLRRRIVALLEEQGQLGQFLETPIASILPSKDPETSLLQTKIGPYKLLKQIGEGGMGAVFLAEQEQPVARQVAVKIIKSGMDSAEVIARFEQERQTLANMDHPHIARVLDAGATEQGLPYLVMELVNGVPVTRYCDQEQLSIDQRLELFVAVCQAVQHAHQKGIIHRDLKPSNVLVALYDGVAAPKVIDFGVAKATGQQFTEKTAFTGFGHLIGTLEYMSPEQAQFRSLDIDTRSDIYSLGVILYELLTGSTPLDRSRMQTVAFDETLRIIREEEPETVSSRASRTRSQNSRAPNTVRRQRSASRVSRLRELDAIVMKALEKDRTRRYQTANAFAADVMRYLHNEPVQACLPTVGYRLQKFVRRNKTTVFAGILILVALLAGIAGTTWQMLVAQHERAQVVSESREKSAALEAAQMSERKAKDQLFFALLNRARASRFSRQSGQRLESLAAAAEAAQIHPDERLRDEAIAAMALPDVNRISVKCSAPPGTTAVGFDSEYRTYARADSSGTISIRSTDNDQEIRKIESDPVMGEAVYFSPDDRFLLAITDGLFLNVWRVSDGQRVIEGNYHQCWRSSFSSDGQRLAVGQNEQVICFDLATGKELSRWAMPEKVNSLAFHPDGIQLAVGLSQAGVIRIYDTTTATRRTALNVGTMQDQVVAWHPDGERLAISGRDPSIQIWDVTRRRRLAETIDGHSQLVSTLAFHPDGSLLASYSWDGLLRLWDPSTGRPLLQLPVAVSGHPRFSRSGKWIAGVLTREKGELLEVTPSREYRTLVSSRRLGRGAYNPAEISPDGRMLAVGKAEGVEPGVQLWDLNSGQELASLPTGTNFVSFHSPAAVDQPWSLLTCGAEGLQRWPVTVDESATLHHLQIGPPQQRSQLRRAWFARSDSGQTLTAVTQEGGTNQILDIDSGRVLQSLGVHPDGDVRALSSDGKWAASSGWHSQTVRLWNIASGKQVHEWTVGRQTFVFFTPDSRSLIISRSDEVSFWDVESLQPGLRIGRDSAHKPSHLSFSPDGHLMAIAMAPAAIHLKEAKTGRTVATLDDPHGDHSSWHGFTPDGRQLVVVSSYSNAIHVWNLEAIRSRLMEMKLDWDSPEVQPLKPSGEQPKVLTIEVIAAEPVKPR
ncbi:MAG: protein kinase [Planctomyces sp.]|nr:protein kinase [Planctomyces sp.]